MEPNRKTEDPLLPVTIVGGNFARSSYKLSAMAEDVKNCIVEMLQVVYEGQSPVEPVCTDVLDSLTAIRTRYGNILVGDHYDREGMKMEGWRSFKVPIEFFFRGRQSCGVIYERITKALKSIAACSFRIAAADGSGEITELTSLILDPKLIRPRQDASVTDTRCTAYFAMSKESVAIILDGYRGFYRFVNNECMRLTTFSTKRIFVLLCGQRAGMSLSFSMELFVSMLGLAPSLAFRSRLEKRVLVPAEAEINAVTSIRVDCTVDRHGNVSLKVLQNDFLEVREDLTSKYPMFPPGELTEFLRTEAGMTPDEILSHSELFACFGSRRYLMEKLPSRWRKIIDRYPASGRRIPEEVRQHRIALLVGTMRGMLADLGIQITP